MSTFNAVHRARSWGSLPWWRRALDQFGALKRAHEFVGAGAATAERVAYRTDRYAGVAGSSNHPQRVRVRLASEHLYNHGETPWFG